MLQKTSKNALLAHWVWKEWNTHKHENCVVIKYCLKIKDSEFSGARTNIIAQCNIENNTKHR